MIMVPTQNLFKEQDQQEQEKIHHTSSFYLMTSRTSSWYDHCSGGGGGETCLGLSHHKMVVEDGSRTSSDINESPSSSSKGTKTPLEDQNKDGSWLQLGLGGWELPNQPTRKTHNLIELNLSSGSNTDQHVNNPTLMELQSTQNSLTSHHHVISSPHTNFLFQHPTTSFSQQQQKQDVSWGSYRPNPRINPTTSASTSSFTTSMNNTYNNYLHRFQNPVLDIVGPSHCLESSDVLRVIDPPRRRHSGVWIILQASHNQEKEAFLPQIPKNYLRIKDGRTTVRLLMKYLVNKLRLSNESEIEIRCRGQQLGQHLTIQYVRDHLWMMITSSSSSDLPLLTLPSSPTDHLMILHYSRSNSMHL